MNFYCKDNESNWDGVRRLFGATNSVPSISRSEPSLVLFTMTVRIPPTMIMSHLFATTILLVVAVTLIGLYYSESQNGMFKWLERRNLPRLQRSDSRCPPIMMCPDQIMREECRCNGTRICCRSMDALAECCVEPLNRTTTTTTTVRPTTPTTTVSANMTTVSGNMTTVTYSTVSETSETSISSFESTATTEQTTNTGQTDTTATPQTSSQPATASVTTASANTTVTTTANNGTYATTIATANETTIATTEASSNSTTTSP